MEFRGLHVFEAGADAAVQAIAERLRDHPDPEVRAWVKVLTVHRPTSLTAALDLITTYFA